MVVKPQRKLDMTVCLRRILPEAVGCHANSLILSRTFDHALEISSSILVNKGGRMLVAFFFTRLTPCPTSVKG